MFLAPGACDKREAQTTPRAAEPPANPDVLVPALRERFERVRVLMPDEIATLQTLHRAHPAREVVRALLESALVRNEDWTALIQLCSEVPEAQRTAKQQFTLAKMYFKAQQFDDAIAIARPLLDASPDDANIRWLVAYSTYFTGNLTEAARLLDEQRDALVKAGRTDALLVRGLIHLEQHELQAAVNLIGAFLQHDPNSVPGCNAMGRALVEMGRRDEAQRFFDRSNQLRAKLNEVEARQARVASRVKMIDEAWEAGRFDECESLINETLPDCKREMKVSLLYYLARIYYDSGRIEQAKEAQRDAETLAEQSPDGNAGVVTQNESLNPA